MLGTWAVRSLSLNCISVVEPGSSAPLIRVVEIRNDRTRNRRLNDIATEDVMGPSAMALAPPHPQKRLTQSARWTRANSM
jgi:hypothetical protein